MKDRVPFELRLYVVYKFVCDSCKADYTGYTKKRFSQRWKALSNNDCFPILDYATTQYSAIMKEGMHIGLQKQTLNKHVNFLACFISV